MDLNEVMVSANRWKKRKDEIPNRISQITRENLLLENPPTSTDICYPPYSSGISASGINFTTSVRYSF